jgi:hypothetical protein
VLCKLAYWNIIPFSRGIAKSEPRIYYVFGREKAPLGQVGLLVLHVEEVMLLRFVIVVQIVVACALVYPLPVMGSLSNVPRSAASQQEQKKYGFHIE